MSLKGVAVDFAASLKAPRHDPKLSSSRQPNTVSGPIVILIAHRRTNPGDLLAVIVEQRTWYSYDYAPFWVVDLFNINRWMIVSSMIQLGMSWWQAWICVWLGYGIATPFLVLNARPSAVLHVTFPVVNRTSFGIFGSLWCISNLGVVCGAPYGMVCSLA
ncbi:permease for cytosine/purines, uracil, thiamine, allantoin-domain-containing protein [Pisolithus orientalis]|uniref:permease for cytosine/purines, uracil, thiamine, allantoin-domain-containing protein n=1 Tax=Pisolithus orientalis TaxID=936130 RepID=UPI002225326D|nr:permease for cytosine/purines, uracil, thiamine, allantoin-domain-containing protein [Pisolithus orientalis]KAI6019769.1 permease for cytosine/purines, uracil, thiamine, allantoin-domain-containing protein [Pisolithus orientalis]